jgi:hypothetical protein
MTRIVAKTVALGLLIVVTYSLLWLIPPKPYLVYASLLDKQQRLVNIPAPRLIFVGGSGVALGLDSALIETKVNRPVLNMGVNAGFGLHYMLAQVQPWVQPGDIVLIVPEYEHFYGDLAEGDQNLLWALRIQPEMVWQLSWQQLLHLLPDLPVFIQQRMQEIARSRPDPIYNRNAFTAHGDFVNHLDLPSTPLALSAIDAGNTINGRALQLLADFRHEVEQQGGQVYLIYPAIAESFWAFGKNRQVIETLNSAILQQNVMQPLTTPAAAVWPDPMFFDTVYHLTRQGRQLRSELLAERLAVLLGSKVTAK